ncbi:phage tail sheath C-terminal domain-containing protein [uncultured Pseudacidovorax sp.]|uniref:phage tail sheath family protein n=1 Tax=uncultured Pseudacidovorax sp. TaxID=679313 RepID=UPI0025D763B9|nr:phage tail sheath C-terminal domain-containing protein [uncultured Pseudacidovorax sp.]
MAVMKTPGVYIVEKNAFPNAVVEVATAVPAFIGYTAKADRAGRDLQGKPWRITSLAEFEALFGGAPQPRFRLQVVEDPVADPPPTEDMRRPRAQVGEFEHQGRHYRLMREPGRAGNRYLLHQAMRLFFANGGGPCYVVSVGLYGDAANAPEIEAGDDVQGLLAGLTALEKEQEPTLVVVPDAVLLSRDDCAAVQTAMLRHCGDVMRNRFAILDVWAGDLGRQHPAGDCIAGFRDAIGTQCLQYGAAYYPWLHTTVLEPGEFRRTMVQSDIDLSALIANELARDTCPVDEALLAKSAFYVRLRDQALRLMNLMPPSAAMAGLYTLVDSTRGVWKAPANIAVNEVTEPAVALSQDEQEDLNVGAQGKSVNAIRSFTGEDVLVWGARTLDGNSADWRYVNVRRTLIMIEESFRLACKALVFEPNTAATWTTARAMLTQYLASVWKRGGLAGATAEDAFSVHVGVGQTMTPEDILEGIMRITVLVAPIRPAEFVEITFHQQMQKS